MKLMNRRALPRGDGHTVIVFPGLASDHKATAPLRKFCKEQGYDTRDWGRGLNRGPAGNVDRWIEALAEHVDRLLPQPDRQFSLIGWSLGGIYAREVAKLLPGRTRRVITLGTPFAGTADQTNVGWVYRLLNGRSAAEDPRLSRRMRQAPPVPTTSIYSRSDGVVAWQACLDVAGPNVENIEVGGSHCGLGWNPRALAVIADRLARIEPLSRPAASSTPLPANAPVAARGVRHRGGV